MTAEPTVSIVVPCHNEAATLPELIRQVGHALHGRNYRWQLIAVDDGSSDTTAEVLRELSATNPHVKSLIFSRNFGKEPAMLAGLTYARGDYVVIMDGDLQHPPSLIPKMLDQIVQTDVDQVIAKRNRTGDSWYRTQLSRIYYRLVNNLVERIELTDGAGDFRVLSRRAVDTLLSMDERSRFSKGLFSWIGFPTSVIEYENEQRRGGESSWTLRSLFNYALDGVMSFNAKPLRLVATLGGIVVALALCYLAYLIVVWFFQGVAAPGYITLIAAVIGFSGIQLLALGALGEYVGRIYQEVKQRPHYVVMEEHGFDR
ncbi:MAG: glycosyltransferase family 2 protein [Bowdeniella nasicola]|nr:glycosyltransferase family 2 protein [Bowdeniella nasicola]